MSTEPRSTATNGEDFDRACRFLNALVPAIQRYGISSSAMEAQLARVARALHVRGQFRVQAMVKFKFR